MIHFYASFWPPVAATLVLAIASATPIVHRTRPWVVLAGIGIGVALLLYVPRLLRTAASPINNVLTRDVVASLVLALAIPSLIAWLGWVLVTRGTPGKVRCLAALAATLATWSLGPWVVLLVHCTSGDCL